MTIEAVLTELCQCEDQGGGEDLLKAILDKADQAVFTAADPQGRTLLMVLALMQLDASCCLLIDRMGYMINHVSNSGETALIYSLSRRLVEASKKLSSLMMPEALTSVATLTTTEADGAASNRQVTALTLALEMQQEDVFNILVARMPEEALQESSTEGITPLIATAYLKWHEACLSLIEKLPAEAIKAKLSTEDGEFTVLTFIANNNHHEDDWSGVCRKVIDKISIDAVLPNERQTIQDIFGADFLAEYLPIVAEVALLEGMPATAEAGADVLGGVFPDNIGEFLCD